MENKYMYSISGVCILLSIWMLFIASKYVFIGHIGKFGIGAFLLGMSGIIFTYFSVENIKWLQVIIAYIIGLILLVVLFFWSLPTYTYKEALTKVENTTEEKVIQTRTKKIHRTLYYLHKRRNLFI